MYTFVNYFSQSFHQANSTLISPLSSPLPPLSHTQPSSTLYKCKICKTSYKKAINEFKA
ncbi:hypothetical protein C1645_828601 [Glomus cerebriforme]|uniref:Uncharacterized protein n=1 Tax=Glomus cerebriforme TaxID=658196 RepID=A0A397SSE0_9GLOM|nr:hypothetical protein C1645_828601 [Glomus cerebriforme]